MCGENARAKAAQQCTGARILDSRIASVEPLHYDSGLLLLTAILKLLFWTTVNLRTIIVTTASRGTMTLLHL